MIKFIEKEGTHVVLKESDIHDHLTKAEADILGLLYEKIINGRNSLGKKENKYYVVNKDEPYANDIIHTIKYGEINKLKKSKKQAICIEDKIADKLTGLCDYRVMYLVNFHYGSVEVEELKDEDLTRNLKQPTLFDKDGG